MPIAEARVETERPGRYLVQLCKHFANKGRHLGHRPRAHAGEDAEALRDMRAVAEQARVTWSETEGEVGLPWGRITLRATLSTLTLRAEAVDRENLGRLQDLVTGHVERFGRRDGLQVSWRESDTPAQPLDAAEAFGGGPGPHRRHLKGAGLVTAVALVLAVHLGFGGAVLANWQWTGWAVGGVLAVVLVKVVVLGRLAVHHRGRAARGR